LVIVFKNFSGNIRVSIFMRRDFRRDGEMSRSGSDIAWISLP